MWEQGPSGGTGGQSFRLTALPGQRIVKVNCRTGRVVDSLIVTFGNLTGGDEHDLVVGGEGGELGEELEIPEGDHITSVTGSYGQVVDTITFITHERRHRRYGRGEGQKSFHYRAPDGHEIAGFVGDHGGLLDSLGVILRRVPPR